MALLTSDSRIVLFLKKILISLNKLRESAFSGNCGSLETVSLYFTLNQRWFFLYHRFWFMNTIVYIVMSDSLKYMICLVNSMLYQIRDHKIIIRDKTEPSKTNLSLDFKFLHRTTVLLLIPKVIFKFTYNL